MTILFCNIGWMENYHGQTKKDQILGGGAYVKAKGMGHEVCNFLPHDSICFGYVQPPGAKDAGEGHIRIEKLEAKNADSVDDITVIWTATRPDGGTVVVGWYKHATVYGTFQPFKVAPPIHSANGLYGYWITAASADVMLLPMDERTLAIPRQVKGGIGQANIWYAQSAESEATVRAVLALVGGKRTSASTAHSRTTDPEHNAKVESAAVHTTRQYFESCGYAVESVEADNVGWDLEATSGKLTLKIEVKGLSGQAPIAQLTPNEFKAFDEKNPDYRLAIVTTTLKEPHLMVCRFSSERQAWVVDAEPGATISIKRVESAIIEIGN
jgi:hypothetical protein